MEVFVLAVPFGFALLFWLANQKTVLHLINLTGAVLLLAGSMFSTYRVMISGPISYPFLNGLFYLDALSVIVLDTIIIVSFMVCLYSVGYLDEEYRHQVLDLKKIKLFYCLTYTFIFTMVLVVVTQNLGLIWIAIEATTLASAFLVGFYNNKGSVEAAWKYIIICSVGIAFALLGIIFLHLSSANAFQDSKADLNWLFLFTNAAKLQGSLLKISFIFILLGFGTKVGLAPMHTWLPDAHSQAPSPISALLSGVLLNSAMYGIIRVLAIVNKNLGSPVFAGRLLIFAGLLSIGTAAVFILSQKDYKRLLAYSSIEHMGIISFGLGIFTPISVFAMIFHMLNHAFTKSMLFLASGNLYLKYNSKEISKVTGLLKVMPFTGSVLLLGLFAIAGLPPFSVFSSELGIIISAFDANHFLAGAVFIFLVALVFAGIAATMLRMFFGNNQNQDVKPGELNSMGIVAMAVLLVIICLTGLYLPQPLKTLITSASGIITGGL
jgi:hydrogenase-4 component F